MPFFISYFDKAEGKPLLISEPRAPARKGAHLLWYYVFFAAWHVCGLELVL